MFAQVGPGEKAKLPEIEIRGLLCSSKGFSISSGKIENAFSDDGKFASTIDLIWDPPTGLASNNKKLQRSFTGSGGIGALGKVAIDKINQVDVEKKELYIKAEEIDVGQSYFLLGADGKRLIVLQVTKYDQKRE